MSFFTDNPALFAVHQQSYASGTLPDGTEPLVFSDFENGVYLLNGAPVAVEDIWEENADWGGSFDPLTQIVPDEGLTSGGSPALLDSIAASLDLNVGITIIMVANMDGSSSNTRAQASFNDAPAFNNEQISEFLNSGEVAVSASMYDYSDGVTPVTGLPIADNHKFASTIKPDAMSMSVEGGAVETFIPTGVTPAKFAVTANQVSKIRSIGLYPAQPDGDLPALSAL